MTVDKGHDSSLGHNQPSSGGKPHLSERNSGIEFLKVFAILLIISCHVVQTLKSENTLIGYQDYVLDLTIATTNLQQLVLVIVRCTGLLGNSIFFICSAWSLLDRKTINKKKWWFMLLEVWSVSVVILAVACILRAGNVTTELIIKSLFPTTFYSTWYMTCYLLFYLIYPILNGVIERMSQTDLLKAASLLFLAYFGIGFVRTGLLFSTELVIWITIYFVVAYIKLYAKNFAYSTKANLILLFIALAGQVGIILITNFLGLRFSIFANSLLYWRKNNNPFLIVAAICLFNLVRTKNWKNYIVNHISKRSMLIYIIHENIILRMYYRPYLINFIYENFGYQYIVFWVFVLVLVILFVSVCLSLLYEHTLQGLVKPVSEKLCETFDILYQKYENLMLRFH